ncbi:MAG: UDP-N-acetylmuramoyl-tripeptide--D-alanyl-D-alanine ligase [Pseudomonadota bacterium]
MTTPIPWTTADILKATAGELLYGDIHCAFAGVSIDSRRITPDDLFVAIKGEVHDGHSFAGDVIASGVRGLVISKNNIDAPAGRLCRQKKVVCVAVTDTTKALGDLAAFQRNRSNVSVVAITGSNGKTTTRTMTAAVVARCFRTLATSGNLNNEIGLPLTLLNLNPDHQWAVVELGMNRPGEIGRLAEICRPNIGVITNIGPAHLEGLGSVAAVMEAKGELLAKIGSDGTAVLNADDPRLLRLADKTPANVLLFGVSEGARIRARSIQAKGLGLAFTLTLPSESISVELDTPGSFMISNALAAAAVGHLLGVSAAEIKKGLEGFVPVKGRLNILKTRRGIHIIDDTYNANPGSMSVAIATLRALKKDGRGVLIIGDMLELGQYSESMHREIGALSAKSKISRLYATGKFAQTVAAGARDENMDSGNIMIGSKDEIFQHVTGWLESGDWILVKGSRSMAMETIVAKLMD